MEKSFFALKQESRQGFQGLCLATKWLERAKCTVGQLACDTAGFFETDNGGVSGLLGLGVFAGSLAKLFAGLGDVQDVVDDLKGQTYMVTEISQRAELGRRALGAHAAEAHRTAKQCGSLAFMNVPQGGDGHGLAFGLKVRDLAGDQFQRTGCARNLKNDRFV